MLFLPCSIWCNRGTGKQFKSAVLAHPVSQNGWNFLFGGSELRIHSTYARICSFMVFLLVFDLWKYDYPTCEHYFQREVLQLKKLLLRELFLGLLNFL